MGPPPPGATRGLGVLAYAVVTLRYTPLARRCQHCRSRLYSPNDYSPDYLEKLSEKPHGRANRLAIRRLIAT